MLPHVSVALGQGYVGVGTFRTLGRCPRVVVASRGRLRLSVKNYVPAGARVATSVARHPTLVREGGNEVGHRSDGRSAPRKESPMLHCKEHEFSVEVFASSAVFLGVGGGFLNVEMSVGGDCEERERRTSNANKNPKTHDREEVQWKISLSFSRNGGKVESPMSN